MCAAATIFFGIVPSPLFDLARDVGDVVLAPGLRTCTSANPLGGLVLEPLVAADRAVLDRQAVAGRRSRR